MAIDNQAVKLMLMNQLSWPAGNQTELAGWRIIELQ